MAETAWNYCTDEEYGYFSSDELSMVKKMTKYVELYPDDVRIIKTAEENGGSIYCRVRKSWSKPPAPPRTRNITEEQREALAAHMREINAQKPR